VSDCVERPSVQVMGIVNVTPDSFSDGGQFFKPEEAVRRARNLIADGADIIDLGGESTRPGATPLGWEEEWSRLEPVLSALQTSLPSSHPSSLPSSLPTSLSPVLPLFRPRLSVDTYHPETAERALALGADIINCVYEGTVPEMLKLLAANERAELVLPFRPGDAEEPWKPFADRVYLDPMIGFGTTREEDLELLRAVPELARRGRVLVGASRKRIVKKLTGEKVTGKNLGGNLGIAAWCALNGASVVRVHDVLETVQLLKVLGTIGNGR